MQPSRHRRAPMRGVIVSLVIVGFVTTGVAASAATSTGTSGAGIGSDAALAAPNCDPTTKRIKLPYYAAPPCVKPWKQGADNGGATAQGVTKDTIKVAVLWSDLPPEAAAQGIIIDQGTGKPGTEPNAVIDSDALLSSVYQTWGRKIEYTFVKASGSDEASARADALRVAELKPFAVFDYAAIHGGGALGGGIVFQSALQGKVPIYGNPSTGLVRPEDANNPLIQNAGEWAGKALVGGKAKWAGDEAMQGKKRVFGVVYPTGSQGYDLSVFTEEFAKHDGKAATEISYDLGIDQAEAGNKAEELSPTIIAKLKSAGVTTVIDFAEGRRMTPALTRQATAQEYFPEWVITGATFQDINVLARMADQEQMAHAFGLLWFTPWVTGYKDPGRALFEWYWGTDRGTRGPGALGALLTPFYNGVMMAGPKLNAKTYQQALLKFPPSGGAFDDQVSTQEVSYVKFGSPPPRGSAIGWFDTETSGPSQALGEAATGPGVYRYLNGGKRYVTGSFPTGEPKLFNKANSVDMLDQLPPTEQPPSYPCDNCPSSGGGPEPSLDAG